MSESSDQTQASKAKAPAKTAAERQAAARRRRIEQGRNQVLLWLTAEEKAKVKDFLAGKLGDDLAKFAAERDNLASHLENSRSVIRQQQDLIADLRDSQYELSEALREAKQKLADAEQALNAKPAKTFKVPELPNRRALIASEMSQDKGWDGKTSEFSVTKLKQQYELAKKFATEIRHASSRVAGLVQITSGEKLLEQSKKNTAWGGWSRFESPLISPAEKALLMEACVVMGRLESDVERAGSDVAKLHKQREAEDAARRAAAAAALDATLFKQLDRRGEVLFIALVTGNRGWVGSGWDDLLEGAKGKGASWKSAAASFREALNEAKGTAIDRVADGMKTKGKSAEELASEVAEKYHHPDTREKYGQLADQVTAFLVSEQLSGSK